MAAMKPRYWIVNRKTNTKHGWTITHRFAHRNKAHNEKVIVKYVKR